MSSTATPESECIHHWRIETPNGPTSRGVCRLCGAEKVYRNWLNDWGDMEQHRPAPSALAARRWGNYEASR